MRTERIAEQIRGEVARVLRDESADPRIGMLTITRVKLSADLSEAILFWSPLATQDEDEIAKIADGLDSANGFVRRRLASNLNLRRTPALKWKHDPSMAEGSRTLALLRSLPDTDETDPREESRDEPDGEEA